MFQSCSRVRTRTSLTFEGRGACLLRGLCREASRTSPPWRSCGWGLIGVPQSSKCKGRASEKARVCFSSFLPTKKELLLRFLYNAGLANDTTQFRLLSSCITWCLSSLGRVRGVCLLQLLGSASVLLCGLWVCAHPQLTL